MRFSITIDAVHKDELDTILADLPVATKGFERIGDSNHIAFLYEREGGIGSPDVDRDIECIRARIQTIPAIYQGLLPLQHVPYSDSMGPCDSSSSAPPAAQPLEPSLSESTTAH